MPPEATTSPATTLVRVHGSEHAMGIAHADTARWQVLQAGSKSFASAAWLLPAATRRATAMVYAYCRRADDAIDDANDDTDPLAALQTQLDRIYARVPASDPVETGFCEAVCRFDIPRHVPQALLEGFLWDSQGRRYGTLEQLEEYCVRVASSVGVMMSSVLGVRDSRVLARACNLGVAMQLTNIARDVGEDARNGRVYVPLDWLREEGLDADELVRAPQHSPALGRVVRRLLDAAQAHYERADIGVSHLPRSVRPPIYAARLIYADIGRAIRRNGYDSISKRAYTSIWRKLWLIMWAFSSLAWRARPLVEPAQTAAALLVEGSREIVTM